MGDLTNKLKIGVVAIILLAIIAIIFYHIFDKDNENFMNVLNDSPILSYDLYDGKKISGHSIVKISQANYNSAKGYILNITTDYNYGAAIGSTFISYTDAEFEPLYILYKDNSTAPMLPERILELKFENNSALMYSKYLERTGEGLGKSYSVIEKNETINLNKSIYTQAIFRFLKIRNIQLQKEYKGQFTLVNQDMTIEILGKERLNTSAGSFDCWIAREILYKSDRTERSIVWYSVDYTFPIKIKNEDTGSYQVLSKI